MRLGDGAWTLWREDADFYQRFSGNFSPHGATGGGAWTISHDQGWTLSRDLDMTYTKVGRL